METFSNLKRYDIRGRRVAAFSKIVEDNKLEIFLLFASPKDQFSKDLARQVYASPNANLNGKQYHPVIYRIPIEENKPKWSFLNHIRENFYIKREVNYRIHTFPITKMGKITSKTSGTFIKIEHLTK